MKHLLFAGSICLALLLASGVLADPDLVIYYSYDNFGAVVPDESGKGYDGTVVGDVTPEANGQRGGAARFAQGSYLDLDGPNIAAADIPVDGMTLCAWINIESTGEHHAIFNARAADETWVIHPEARDTANQYRWLLRANGGDTIFDVRAGQPVVGQWMHFAGTYDSEVGAAYLYINGEPVGSEPARIPNAKIASDWGLGARVGYNIDNARPFTGLMDDFCIYKKALSQEEIQIVMGGGPPSASPVPDEGSLISTWGEIKGLR
jgi:hypothetical protein